MSLAVTHELSGTSRVYAELARGFAQVWFGPANVNSTIDFAGEPGPAQAVVAAIQYLDTNLGTPAQSTARYRAWESVADLADNYPSVALPLLKALQNPTHARLADGLRKATNEAALTDFREKGAGEPMTKLDTELSRPMSLRLGLAKDSLAHVGPSKPAAHPPLPQVVGPQRRV